MEQFHAVDGASHEFNELAREIYDNLEEFRNSGPPVGVVHLADLLSQLLKSVMVLAEDEVRDNDEKGDKDNE